MECVWIQRPKIFLRQGAGVSYCRSNSKNLFCDEIHPCFSRPCHRNTNGYYMFGCTPDRFGAHVLQSRITQLDLHRVLSMFTRNRSTRTFLDIDGNLKQVETTTIFCLPFTCVDRLSIIPTWRTEIHFDTRSQTHPGYVRMVRYLAPLLSQLPCSCRTTINSETRDVRARQ